MSSALYRTDYMLKYLKENWEFWDSETMDICKQHNGHGFHLYVAINNKLLYQVIRPRSIKEDLKLMEDNRVFKIEKKIKKDF